MFENFAHCIRGIKFRQEQSEDRLDCLWVVVIGIVTEALRERRESIREE
jgi:hypothetical protein